MTGKRGIFMLLTAILMSSIGAGGLSTPVPSIAHERDVADVRVFYEPLARHGTWIDVQEHGRVWVPRGISRGWRPYTDGRWVYTDFGWTWVSEHAWGWAPFHYGRWSSHPRHGWYWVPDTVWGPSWVSWRHSPGWIGWAPLPPRVTLHAGMGLGAAHSGVDIDPGWFSFIEERHVFAPRIRTVIAPPTRNVHLVRVTHNVTNYTVINNRIVNHSIDVDRIERVVRRPVERHRIVDVDASDATRGPRVRAREREVVLVRPAALRERSDRQDQEHARERRDNERRAASEARERAENRDERRGLHQRLTHEREALAERHRRERQNRPEDVSAEDLRKRQERVHDRREEGRPRMDDEKRRERRQHAQDTQGMNQRNLPPADQGDKAARDLQSPLQEQRGERPARPRAVSPAERRERREAVRQGGEEGDKQRRDTKRERRKHEEQGAVPPGATPAN